MQIRTTAFPDQKNREKYFDADEFIHDYEKKTGEPVADGVKELVRAQEKTINDAYLDGYRDGKEAAHNE